MRMSETSRPAVEEQPQIGSYFVANYPPFSVWTKEDVDRAARPALATNPEPDVPLGIYLHIPFCRKRCHFCYFRVYTEDRKSTRLNSSHTVISYAVFCLKKKKKRH